MKAYRAFVETLRSAIASVPRVGLAVEWQRELDILEKNLAAILNAEARYQIGEMVTIANWAGTEVAISRRLDGLSFFFAGPEYERKLGEALTEVVRAAWDVAHAP